MQRRVLRAWAADAARFAEVLARREPTWGSTVAQLGDGLAVLCGPGMYVNSAMAVGIDVDVTAAEFDEFERLCARVGVRPAVEVSPSTRPTVVADVRSRGYEVGNRRAALRRSLDDVGSFSPPDPTIIVEPAAAQLDVWQTTAALGWGHDTAERRRVSDAFAGAASEVDGDGFVIARDAASGRAIACASLTINDDVATLGAMSTVPAARRRGAQAALIRHRLRRAADAGCTIATTTTAPGSDSERNLQRHGFVSWFTVEQLSRTGAG